MVLEEIDDEIELFFHAPKVCAKIRIDGKDIGLALKEWTKWLS